MNQLLITIECEINEKVKQELKIDELFPSNATEKDMKLAKLELTKGIKVLDELEDW